MAQAVADQETETLNAIPDAADDPQWRPGNQKRGFPTKRFGTQESTDEKRAAFMEQTSELTPDDWQRSITYVYQWAPSVDLTRGGRDPKYRKIYTRHMSEEDIKRDLGSGTYELKLNQLDPKGREKTVNRIVISIMDYSFPPNIPPGPWLDDPKNAEWAWARPLLEQKYAKPATGAASTGGPTWDQMVQFLRDQDMRRPHDNGSSAKDSFMTAMVTILPAVLQQSNQANDPAKFVQALAALKEMTGPQSTESPLMTMLLEQVKAQREEIHEMRKANTDLMMKMFDMKGEQTKQPSALEQAKSMGELFVTLSGIVQPPAPREPWENVVSEVGPKVLETIDRGIAAWGMRSAMRPNPGQQIQRQPQPVPQANQPGQPTQNPPNPQPQTDPGVDTVMQSMLVNIAALAAQGLNLGLTGDQFADQICYKFGQGVYDQFLSQMPKDQLIDKFKATPEAWAILGPFENLLPEFVESFYSYADGPPAEQENEANSISPGPVAVKVPKKGKKK